MFGGVASDPPKPTMSHWFGNAVCASYSNITRAKGRAASYEPLLKWPGGKRRLLLQIMALLPDTFQRYFEPFVGGGALFFGLAPNNAILADVNDDLMNCYRQVRDLPREVVSALSQWRNSEAHYYSIRDYEPGNDIERAARIIYLTTLSFNGIFRVNQKGEFNVPYGNKTHLNPADSERIVVASRALQGTSLITGDFEFVVRDAAAGDLIYLDPPYTVAHSNNGFIKYNSRLFAWSDQERLSRVAHDLVLRGCFVIVSNADHPTIRSLYSGFECQSIQRVSVMAASSSHRKTVTECLFHRR